MLPRSVFMRVTRFALTRRFYRRITEHTKFRSAPWGERLGCSFSCESNDLWSKRSCGYTWERVRPHYPRSEAAAA